jgi:hypothetical protein
MANIKEVCLLLLVGIVIVTTAEPFIGGGMVFLIQLLDNIKR